MTTLEAIRHKICCNYSLARFNDSWSNHMIVDISEYSLDRELGKVPSESVGVRSRDKLILEDFFHNWEQLLCLRSHLREKERKMITKALNVMRLDDDARLIEADSDFYGIFNISLIRSHVKNMIYIIFCFSSSKAVIYEVNFKKKMVKGWGERILSATKEGVVLDGSSLPTGPIWIVHSYTFPLQCKTCSIKGDVERWAS